MVYRNRILPTGGEQGPQGPPGADGADGSVWHWVTGTPAGSLGKVGDWATRTDTGATWEKTGASTWTSRGSLRGPQGVQGIQGPQGATGPQGPVGDTGPQGESGPPGAAGARYLIGAGGDGRIDASPRKTVTTMRISGWDINENSSIEDWIRSWHDAGVPGNHGTLWVYRADLLVWAQYRVEAVSAFNIPLWQFTLTVTYVAGTSASTEFGTDAEVWVNFVPHGVKGDVGPQGDQGAQGIQGATGATGPAGTITGATATGLAAGASPTVTLGGTPSARTFAFGIPRGATGAKGDTGSTGPKGDQGDTGPAGTAATVSVGTTTTGAPGTNAAVTQSGTAQARTFNFTIPRGATGAPGEASDLSIGTVTTVPENGAATASITGSPPHQVLNLGLPRGATGQDGDAGVLGGAKAHLATAQSIPNSQWTALSRTSADFIVAGTVSWSFSPSRLQCFVEQGGWWMVGASIGWDGASNTGRRILAVETWTGTDPGVGNGATIVRAESPAGQSSLVSINGTTVAYLAANTNVRMLAYQNSGSSLSTRTEVPTELWLTRVL